MPTETIEIEVDAETARLYREADEETQRRLAWELRIALRLPPADGTEAAAEFRRLADEVSSRLTEAEKRELERELEELS